MRRRLTTDKPNQLRGRETQSRLFWNIVRENFLSRKLNQQKWVDATLALTRGIPQHKLEHNHTHFILVDEGELGNFVSSADLAWYEFKTRQGLEQATAISRTLEVTCAHFLA